MKRTLVIIVFTLSILLLIIAHLVKKQGGIFISSAILPDQIFFFFTDPLNKENPTGNVKRTLIKIIDSATLSIDAAVYGFNQKDILHAFLRARQRGVNIRLITEADFSNNPCYKLGYQAMQNAGILIRFDQNVGKHKYLMHNKFIIIDRQRVWTGSCNLTESEITSNANNIFLVNSKALAKAYTIEFEEMFEENRWGNKKYDNNEELFMIASKKVELYFSPSDEVETRIIQAIHAATSSIHLAMFCLTNNSIYKAINKAIKRGVIVRAIFDERGISSNYSKAFDLVKRGNGVIDALSGLVHHKFAIIDKDEPNPLVITGSANWSDAGMNNNDENTLIIHDKFASVLYFKQWSKLYSDAILTYPSSANIKPPKAPRVTHHHYNCQINQTRIEWNTSQLAATSYNLYKSERSGGPYKFLVNISKKEAQSSSDYQKTEKIDGIEGSYYAHYNDFNVTVGTTYYYVVTTLVGHRESLYSNEYSEKVR